MTPLLFFLGAVGSLPPGALHTPLDRATTAARVYVDCLVDRARAAGTGRAAPSVALNIAQRECRREERALDDAYRFSQRTQGQRGRGVPRAEIRRLVGEAEARIIAARGGRR
jgi:hypothetical protein